MNQLEKVAQARTAALRKFIPVIITPGREYALIQHRVVPGEGLVRLDTAQQISFVKGSKDPMDLPTYQDGTTDEQLVGVLIDRAKAPNQELPDDMLTRKLELLLELQELMVARTVRRAVEGTLGTYKK